MQWSVPDHGSPIACGSTATANKLAAAVALPKLAAQAAIVVDQNSGQVIYARNEHSRMYPASTTKILTALLAIEHGKLNEMISVGDEVAAIPPYAGKAGLKVGDKISMQELLYGLMLPSGNDAAMTIAVHIAREAHPEASLNQPDAIALFAQLMNQRAEQAQAHDSHFANPNGFQNAAQYSTAYDLALIAREAMQEPCFRQVVAAPAYTPAGGGTTQNQEGSPWVNTNKLLQANSPYYMAAATGIKTGQTNEAGFCLVSSASRGDINLVAVVLNSSQTGVWADSATLLEYGFSHPPHRAKQEVHPQIARKTPASAQTTAWLPIGAILGIIILYAMVKWLRSVKR